MINRYTITSTDWVAITTAGQSGSCWIEKNLAGDGLLYINHSESGAPGNDRGFKLKNTLVPISADNDNDIYYARVGTAGNSVRIMVDVV